MEKKTTFVVFTPASEAEVICPGIVEMIEAFKEVTGKNTRVWVAIDNEALITGTEEPATEEERQKIISILCKS